jgi:hypothetical protein
MSVQIIEAPFCKDVSHTNAWTRHQQFKCSYGTIQEIVESAILGDDCVSMMKLNNLLDADRCYPWFSLWSRKHQQRVIVEVRPDKDQVIVIGVLPRKTAHETLDSLWNKHRSFR